MISSISNEIKQRQAKNNIRLTSLKSDKMRIDEVYPTRWLSAKCSVANTYALPFMRNML